MDRIQLENAVELAKAGFEAWEIERLHKAARVLHRLDERACNGYTDWQGKHDAGAEEKADKREERIKKEIATLLASHNLIAYFQGDPRGWPLYLLTPEVHAKGAGYYTQGLAVCPR